MCIHEKYINPFTDYGFKKIFGDEENTELLESLINDILGLEGENKIAKITFKNGELLPDAPTDRKAIFDLLCEDEKGSTFIVELQKIYQEHFQSRALILVILNFKILGSGDENELLRKKSLQYKTSKTRSNQWQEDQDWIWQVSTI